MQCVTVGVKALFKRTNLPLSHDYRQLNRFAIIEREWFEPFCGAVSNTHVT